MLRKALLVLFVLLVLIQFYPVDRENPAASAPIEAPPAVMEILRTSCFDCHSNETIWPWYAYVSPASILVSHDVEEGREHINFSEWGTYDAERKEHTLEEIAEEVEEGEMPLWFYTPLHSGSDLTDEELKTLLSWAEAGREEEH